MTETARRSSAVAERLADFACSPGPSTPGDPTLHDAKRLLLNQLKAAAEAAAQPEGDRLLARAAAFNRGMRAGSASLWWTGARTTPHHAASLHRRLLTLLDFGDSHLPTLGQYTADVLAPLLVRAEAEGQAGRRVLQALAVGVEVAISCASSAAGRTAALCTLRGVDRSAAAHALHRALPHGMGAMAHCPEALDPLGRRWRLQEIALHCRPVPAFAQAPVDAVLSLRQAAGGRMPRRMRVTLSPQAWALGSTQRPDLRHSLAAAWLLGQFSVEEREAARCAHPSLAELGASIEFSVDAEHAGLQACALTTDYHDGSSQHLRIDAFLGAPQQPLSDSQLSELFRNAADPLVLPRRSGEILQALWGLDQAPDARGLLDLLRRPG